MTTDNYGNKFRGGGSAMLLADRFCHLDGLRPFPLQHSMKTDYYDNPDYHSRDHDECDEPRGNDPLIRQDGNTTWFRWQGAWWQAGTLPADARRAFLQASIDLERRQHATTP